MTLFCRTHLRICFRDTPRRIYSVCITTSHQAQSFLSALAVQIQIWRLPKRRHPVACAWIEVIVCRAMPCTPVVPDGKVILSPLEPHLRVVILRHQIEEIRQYHIRLVFRHSVDSLREPFVHIYALPSGDSCCTLSESLDGLTAKLKIDKTHDSS